MSIPLRRRIGRLAISFAAALLTAGAAGAQDVPPPQAVMVKVGWDQKLNTQVPLDLPFKDEAGKDVKLGDYFKDGKPVLLTLVYFQCPMLCNEVLNGVVKSLKGINFTPGKDFEVVTVSFDPSEKPELAAAKKATYLKEYGRPGAEQGWHFLTGEAPAIKTLTETVGFRYFYDEESKQYAHAAGIMVLTPQGKAARYFYGMEFPSKDVRFGLVEASQNRIGSAVDYILLLCYHYDPLTGKYSMVIMNVLRLFGGITVALLGSFLILMVLKERRSAARLRQQPGV